jgi:hypothetical protein
MSPKLLEAKGTHQPKQPKLPLPFGEAETHTLGRLREQVFAVAQRHPGLELEVYAMDQRCKVPQDRRRSILSAFLKGMWKEYLGRWFPSPECKHWCRFFGDLAGVDEFGRLEHCLGLILQSVKVWPTGLIFHLGLNRPGLLLEAEMGLQPFVIEVDDDTGRASGQKPAKSAFWLVSLRHPAFISLLSTIDWLLSPDESLQLAADVFPRVRALPDWEMLDNFISQVQGLPPKAADKEQLIVGKFYVQYRGNKCDLGNTKAFQLIQRLSESPEVYIEYKKLLDDIWGEESLTSESTLQQAVTSLRKKLRKAGIEGLKIDGSKKRHYRLRLSSLHDFELLE